MALPDSLKSLLDPSAYPHPVRSVSLVETHISWILLTGEWAYKIKRPVHFPFVDLRSAQHRAFLCQEEVRLNRRFAPEIYAGVSPITVEDTRVRMDGAGRIIEHAVRMRQFERREELDRLLEEARIEPAALERFGRDLAQIHSGLPVAPPSQEWGRPDFVRAAIMQNLEELLGAAEIFGPADELQGLRAALERRIGAASAWMDERRASGRVRECHGDLHCSNIVRWKSRLLAFDCLEFEPRFRWIDVADEIAFLLADLDSMNRAGHAQAFLGGYLAHSGDFEACRNLNLYKAHRSLVRAKIVALSNADAGKPSAETERAKHGFLTYIRCAQASLSPKRPALILMSGLSGSGKTWIATRLAPLFDAVHVRSDVERKRVAGLGELERSHASPGGGLYSAEASRQLYRRLMDSAEAILSGGYTTIVDATFGSRADRSLFGELARKMRITACVVHCHAPEELLRSRIVERARFGSDASEADTAVLEWQQKRFEPLQPDESFMTLEARTADPDCVQRLSEGIRALCK